MTVRWLLASLALFAVTAGTWAQSQTSGEGNAGQNAEGHGGDASSFPAPSEAPINYDGGKSDADAFDDSGPCSSRWVVNGFTLERQLSIGRSVAQQIESHVNFVSDPVITEYVNRVGQKLVRKSKAPVPFTFKIIDSNAVNALSLPGGFIYLNSGSILAADEEAELAGLLAHEMGHVAVCHAGRSWIHGRSEAPWNPMILAHSDIDNAGGMYGIARFSRGLEGEADYLGIQYMYRAGYDPSALVSYLGKIDAMEKPPSRPGVVGKAFVTHPQNAYRVQKSQEEIQAIPTAGKEYVVTSSEFDDIKARLAMAGK